MKNDKEESKSSQKEDDRVKKIGTPKVMISAESTFKKAQDTIEE